MKGEEYSPKQKSGDTTRGQWGEGSKATEYSANVAGRRCIRSLFWLNEQTSTVQILQIAMTAGLRKGIVEVFLDLGDLSQLIRDLESLHVLYDSSKFVVLVEVDQLLVWVQGGHSGGRVPLSTESDIRKVQTEERNRWRSRVPQHSPIVMVIPTVFGEFP